MSPDSARWYATTNPDQPNHWLKARYLDNQEMRSSGYLQSIHFNMDDNLSLTEEVKERYRRMYTGMFYQRFILGLWVQAEGAIFRDCFSDACLYDDDSAPLGLYSGRYDCYVGVDCGVVHQQAYLEAIDESSISTKNGYGIPQRNPGSLQTVSMLMSW